MTEFTFAPLTPSRLPDLDRFCGERGPHGHGRFAWCGCMRWRMPAAEYQAASPEHRRECLADLVRQDIQVGVLAYADGEPVGWCSVAPRDTYQALERSHTLPRLDDSPVWSVVCFFVDNRYRRQGMTSQLLAAALEYARSEGAETVEGYPVPPGRGYTHMGSPAVFASAGFTDVTPRGQEHRVVRLPLTPDEPAPDGAAPDEPAPDEPAPDEPAPDEPAPDEPALGGPALDGPVLDPGTSAVS